MSLGRSSLAYRPSPTPWAWTVAGVFCGVVLSVVLFAPARWLGGWVAQASAGHLQLNELRGTLWSGSARLTLTGGTGSPDAATLPGRLAWQLSPAWSDAGVGLALQVRADCCVQQAWLWRVVPRWGGVSVAASDNQSSWPAPWLAGLGTPWNTLLLQGQLALQTRGFSLSWVSGRLQVAGQAQLQALDVSSRLSTLEPMGSYQLALSGGAAPQLLLSTLNGSLQLNGSGQWVGSKLRFVGEASALPEAQAALSNLLNIIGRRNGARSIIKVG